jgi:hypothetical protein
MAAKHVMRRAAPLAVWLVLTAAGRLPAQVVAYDPINQPLGQFNGNASSGGGTTWPSSNVWTQFGGVGNSGTVLAGSLTYGQLQTVGNRVDFQRSDLSINPSGSIRSFGSNQGGAGKDLWISVLMNPNPGVDQGLALHNGIGDRQIMVGTPNTSSNIGIRLNSGVTGGDFQVLTPSPAVAANGTTRFVALHLSLTTAVASTITMYVDPDFSSLGTGSAPTGGSTVSYTTANPFPFDSLFFGTSDPGNMVVSLDEYRMGASWVSVSPVPEPSAVLLAGVAGAAGGAWHRRWRGR